MNLGGRKEHGPKKNRMGGRPDKGILMIFVKIAKWGVFKDLHFSVNNAELPGICRRKLSLIWGPFDST